MAYALQQPFKEELEWLQQLDIITSLVWMRQQSDATVSNQYQMRGLGNIKSDINTGPQGPSCNWYIPKANLCKVFDSYR